MGCEIILAAYSLMYPISKCAFGICANNYPVTRLPDPFLVPHGDDNGHDYIGYNVVTRIDQPEFERFLKVDIAHADWSGGENTTC